MPKVSTDILPIQTVAKFSTVLQPHHSPSQSEGSETSSESQGATSPKNSSIAFEHLSPSAKSTSASILAGSPSAHTTPAQVMDNVPSAIISNEGATPSGNDPTIMTPHSTKFIQEHGNMESDFHINEQMDEYGSVSRGGRLLKRTQRYQEMEWHTVRGRGNRGRKGRGS
ncbi:BnaA09g28680D [Brassica napus]|uniref:BnaA09g28680D protein n=1 Tax=Brassica napus TaxID=3708 RepID=A0A078FT86_BRANA|nr:BnaA09g28680D [Brassica napus]